MAHTDISTSGWVGRLPASWLPYALLARWDYAQNQSLELTRADRSSIYGGVHLYCLK